MNIVVGVIGGIVVYKMVYFVCLFMKGGYDVIVVFIEDVLWFVGMFIWEVISCYFVIMSVYEDVVKVWYVVFG